MFGSKFNPVNAYNEVGIETAVSTASPHRLIALLFEGACQAIVIARAGMEAGDIAKKSTSIAKAVDIILNGLRSSLNLEEGDDLAQNLYALYDYMGRRLMHANMHNDMPALDEVLNLLNEIHGAWMSISDQVNNLPNTTADTSVPSKKP